MFFHAIRINFKKTITTRSPLTFSSINQISIKCLNTLPWMIGSFISLIFPITPNIRFHSTTDEMGVQPTSVPPSMTLLGFISLCFRRGIFNCKPSFSSSSSSSSSSTPCIDPSVQRNFQTTKKTLYIFIKNFHKRHR